MRFIFCVILLFAVCAFASGGKAAQISTAAFCQHLPAHHASAADVAYQVGVDVHGNPVAPADLPGNPSIKPPDVMEIPLTVDLAVRLGQPPPAGVQMEALIGFLQITKEGRVVYNGQDLTAQAVYLCKDGAKTEGSKEYTHEPARSKSPSPEATHRDHADPR